MFLIKATLFFKPVATHKIHQKNKSHTKIFIINTLYTIPVVGGGWRENTAEYMTSSDTLQISTPSHHPVPALEEEEEEEEEGEEEEEEEGEEEKEEEEEEEGEEKEGEEEEEEEEEEKEGEEEEEEGVKHLKPTPLLLPSLHFPSLHPLSYW